MVKIKRFFSLFLALAMVMGLVPATSSAADAITYIDYSWDGDSLVRTVKTVTDYEVLDAESTYMSNGYYVIQGEIASYNRIVVTGTAHLILMDNSSLVYERGEYVSFAVNEGSTLYIYAQSEAENMGKLSLYDKGSAIGGDEKKNAGDIIINGGNIEARNTGVRGNAVIGGGVNGNGGNITINGGIITVTGSGDAAGIGDGEYGNGGNITINGGTINVTSGMRGAGIGSGYSGGKMNITINGGDITAKGGAQGPGIGSGQFGKKCNIAITGGTINATGGSSSADIGGGYGTIGSDVVITGGNVKASSIGAGYGEKYNGTLKDGNGNDISLYAFTLSGASDRTVVTDISGFDYGIRDVKTLDNDKLYFWMASAPDSATFTAGGKNYFCRNDMTFRSAHDWVKGICDFCKEECLHSGKNGCVCAACGEYFHNGKVIAHRDGSCTAEGYTSYECLDCGEYYLEVLPSLGGHKYTFTYDSVSHTGDCVNCDYILSGFHDYKNSCVCICGRVSDVNYHHNFSAVYTSPTCTEDGYYTYTCVDCGHSYTETYGSSTGHSGGTTTCTEWATCAVCGETYGDEPIGHMEEYDDGTCLTPVHCWVCGEETTPARYAHEWGEDDYCKYCDTGKPYKFYFTDGEEELFTADVEAHSYYVFKFTQNKGDYSFIGWDGDGDGVADYLGVDLPYDIYVEGDMTFNAVYEKVDYVFIRYYRVGLDSGEYEISDIQKWPVNETINLDYDYAYWYDALGWATEIGGEKVYDYGQQITITEDLELYTFWKPFTITFDLGEGASWVDENGNAIPESVVEGITVYTAPVKPGYKFLYFVGYDSYGNEQAYEFYTDEETGECWMDISPYSSMTLTAVWEECTEHSYVNGKCEHCGMADGTVFAIVGYNAGTKTASVVAPDAGTYTVVFADYEGGRLENVEYATVTFTYENKATALSVSITKDFSLGKDDKVMLWQDMISLKPLCEAYIVK